MLSSAFSMPSAPPSAKPPAEPRPEPATKKLEAKPIFSGGNHVAITFGAATWQMPTQKEARNVSTSVAV